MLLHSVQSQGCLQNTPEYGNQGGIYSSTGRLVLVYSYVFAVMAWLRCMLDVSITTLCTRSYFYVPTVGSACRSV